MGYDFCFLGLKKSFARGSHLVSGMPYPRSSSSDLTNSACDIVERKMLTRNTTSDMWYHFTRSQGDDKKASCNYCTSRISIPGGSTSNLKRHLKMKHPTVRISITRSRSRSPSTVQLEETGAEMREISFPPFSQVEQKCGSSSGSIVLSPSPSPSSSIWERQKSSLSDTLLTPSPSTIHPETQLEMSKLTTKLGLAKAICITCDCWTSINNNSFYAVTVHYFDGETKLNSNLLECSDFSVNHSAINIADWLDAKLNKWNIRNKIVAAVTDNSANIKLAIETLNIPHIACYAHALNLIVHDSIKVNINTVVTKIKTIVQYFISNTALAKLQEIQKGMNKPTLKLKQDIPTRWNSIFDMLNRALSNKEAIMSTLALLQCKGIDSLDAREWEIIEMTVKVLSIFEEITREISSEKTVSLSKTYVLSRTLVKHVSQMLSTKEPLHDEVIGLLNSLLDGLKERFGDSDSTEIISQSIFLDPRFKKTGFGNEDKFKETYSVLVEKIREMNLSQPSRQLPTPKTQHSTSALWEEYDKTYEQLKATSDPSASAIVELDKYVAEPLNNNLFFYNYYYFIHITGMFLPPN
ncbi:Zinc finger BED domain-containing protein 4 [Armadillidium vulgare]|nr:Zinc finger BED domain-containing protein 4 [Armadillidium vulgare]